MEMAYSQESKKKLDGNRAFGFVLITLEMFMLAVAGVFLWPFCGSVAILHSVDRGHGGRSDSLRLGEAQDMKASEFVHKASFARFHVLVISQDIRSELLSVKSRPQQYMQDSSPPSNDDGNNNEDQHTMSCSLGRSIFDFI